MFTRLALAALTLAAVAAPATAQTWKIDGARSTARFVVRHMMVSNVHGSFGKVDEWRIGVPPQVDYVEGCS